MSKRPVPPPECAQCGAAIPSNARACPECGADERTGWRETSIYDGLELPDENDPDENDRSPALRKPEPSNLIGYPTKKVNGIAWYWWCVAVAVLIIAGLSFLA